MLDCYASENVGVIMNTDCGDPEAALKFEKRMGNWVYVSGIIIIIVPHSLVRKDPPIKPFTQRSNEMIYHPIPVSKANFPKTYKETLTFLVVVAVRVCNSDKLNSIDLHFLFDSARPVVLQFIWYSFSIVLSGGNYQKDTLPFIIARQQAGFNAPTFEPAIDPKSGMPSEGWRL